MAGAVRVKIADMAKFLETYKALEQALRENGDVSMTVMDYESTLGNEDSQKLQQCRRIRNYVQHNAGYEAFLVVTDEMQRFLERTLASVLAQRKTAGSLAKRITAVAQGAAMHEVCAWMVKRKLDFTPIVDADGIYLGSVTSDMVVAAVAAGRKPSESVKKIWPKLPEGFPDKINAVSVSDKLPAKDGMLDDVLNTGGTAVVWKHPTGKYVGLIMR